MDSKNVSRRDFLQRMVAAGVGATLVSQKSFSKDKPVEWFKKPGTVVRVTFPGALNEDGSANMETVQTMIDRGLCELTGTKKVQDAWSRFVSPEDVVGLKINTLGLRFVANTKHVSHFHAVTGALANGLARTSIPKNKIIIWDRNQSDMARADFKPESGPESVQCIGGREDGVEETPVNVGGKDAFLYKVLTQKTSALINIALAKTHDLSGITGALKNHYGSISNPSTFHDNGCTAPGIPELNAIESIRSKQRLIVMDALYTVIEGGPRWDLQFMKKTNAILFSTDPVAVDAVLLDTIDKLRKEAGMGSMAEQARFLKLSSNLGLGESNLSKINLIEIKLG